jgi:hypothetical protein
MFFLVSSISSFLCTFLLPPGKEKEKKIHFALWEMGSFAPDLQKQSILKIENLYNLPKDDFTPTNFPPHWLQ